MAAETDGMWTPIAADILSPLALIHSAVSQDSVGKGGISVLGHVRRLALPLLRS